MLVFENLQTDRQMDDRCQTTGAHFSLQLIIQKKGNLDN